MRDIPTIKHGIDHIKNRLIVFKEKTTDEILASEIDSLLNEIEPIENMIEQVLIDSNDIANLICKIQKLSSGF